MLADLMDAFYSKLALHFYHSAAHYQGREEIQGLSATEVSTLELIYLLGGPTCGELSEFLQISGPNLSYRVNQLIEKGCAEKRRDDTDRRRHTLHVTDKFMDYYCVNDAFVASVAERAAARFSPAELEQFEKQFKILVEELME